MHSLPFLLGLAALVGASDDLVSASELAKMIPKLKAASEQVAVNDPPYTHGIAHGEPTCFNNWFSCAHTVFFNRLVMVGDSVSANVTPIYSQDAILANDMDVPSTIKSTRSTAKLESSTKGWQISAKIQVNAGDFQGEVTAQYKDERTRSTTLTKTVEYATTCPPHTTCRIQTITFKATLAGKCAEDPYLLCTNSLDYGPQHEMSACTMDSSWVNSCEQYREYTRKSEPLCRNRRTPQKPCTAQVTLQDNKGEPFRVVVITHDTSRFEAVTLGEASR